MRNCALQRDNFGLTRKFHKILLEFLSISALSSFVLAAGARCSNHTGMITSLTTEPSIASKCGTQLSGKLGKSQNDSMDYELLSRISTLGPTSSEIEGTDLWTQVGTAKKRKEKAWYRTIKDGQSKSTKRLNIFRRQRAMETTESVVENLDGPISAGGAVLGTVLHWLLARYWRSFYRARYISRTTMSTLPWQRCWKAVLQTHVFGMGKQLRSYLRNPFLMMILWMTSALSSSTPHLCP